MKALTFWGGAIVFGLSVPLIILIIETFRMEKYEVVTADENRPKLSGND